MSPEPQLKIAVESNRALITLGGNVGVTQAVAFKRFYIHALMEGIDQFTLECRTCTGMDSTFLGVVLGLALKVKKTPHGRFCTKNVSLPVLKQMASLGLSQFLSGGNNKPAR